MGDSDSSFRAAARPAAAIIVYRLVGTFVIALLGWVILGFLVTVPLGAIFGWSGHPAIPAAPLSVYVIVYVVLLPMLCVAVGWKVTRWIESRLGRVVDARGGDANATSSRTRAP